MWDDYFGWDWYAMRQFAFFALCLFGLASVIGMTEGYPWHQPLTYIFGLISANSTVSLILAIVSLVAIVQFIRFKEGF